MEILVNRNPVPNEHLYSAYLGIVPIEMHQNGMDAMPNESKTRYYRIEGTSPDEARRLLIKQIGEDLVKLT